MGASVRKAMVSTNKGEGCVALGDVIALLGDKWTVLLIGVLSSGPLHFNALMRAAPGISHRMLTLTLRTLEREGLVARAAVATPPRVDYALTALGLSLTTPLMTLARWAADHQGQMARARADYDRR